MNYTDQEKEAIVAQHQQGEAVRNLCTEYRISRSTFYRWAKVHCIANPGASRTFTIRDYDLLQRKVEKLSNIVTVLKSVDCTVSSPLKEKLAALEALYGQYDVHTLCEALEVPRGTFYNHILRNKKGNAWFEKRREEYRILIREVFDEYRQVIGAEKIRTILTQRGYQVSTKYVAGLMHEMGLSSIRTTAKQDFLKQRKPEKKKNVLHQQFYAAKPDQTWVSDVTCFRMNSRYYYICVILDLFSRRVIAYKISMKHSTQLISATFKMAYELRNPKAGLIFHSDRGTQYTSQRFQQLLQAHSTKRSFSNSGKPHDNAVAESFFASLKKEELYRKAYTSEAAFRQGVASYIEFYNVLRPHRTLKNLTPCQAEETYAKDFNQRCGK